MTDLLAFGLAAERGGPVTPETVERLRQDAAKALTDYAFRYLHNTVEQVRRDAVAEHLGRLRPPPGFLRRLRARCDDAGALLVVDAIYAGLGRTGELWPGAEVADVLCVGKALGGGIPLSAALFVREGLDRLWELGPEDVYTHTHVGNPLACAAALVVLEEVPRLLPRVHELGARFEAAGWWGRGLLRAREGSADEALARGVLVVPAGDGRLIQATPPLTLSDDELDEALTLLA